MGPNEAGPRQEGQAPRRAELEEAGLDLSEREAEGAGQEEVRPHWERAWKVDPEGAGLTGVRGRKPEERGLAIQDQKGRRVGG